MLNLLMKRSKKILEKLLPTSAAQIFSGKYKKWEKMRDFKINYKTYCKMMENRIEKFKQKSSF